MNEHFRRDASEILDRLGDKIQRFSGKTVLLTGSLGFLGAQFVHFFVNLNRSGKLAQPCKLIAMDNALRGFPFWFEDIAADVKFVQSDIIATTEFEPCDFIIHAASVASPIFYRIYPIETMDANVIGLRNLLEFTRRSPVESFLFFSSSEIYGDPDPANIPTKETYRGHVSCTGPRACYDESKRYGETLCVSFHQVHKTPVKTARPFNNYGPGLGIHDRRVIPDFARNLLADEDIVLLSDGLATRTFCYVGDAIYGYLLALLSDHNGEAFNIGTETPEITMRELADRMLAASGSTTAKVVQKVSEDKEYLTDNPVRRCPDLTKARTLLGYAPSIDIDEGMRRTLSFYRDVYGKEFAK